MPASENEATYLRIYLEDHAAGAIAGTQRAERLADAEAGAADGPALASIADEIATDRDALLTLMEAFGFEPSRLKSAAAAAGETLGALKPNGHLLARSPLSTVIELEALQMAVRGKRSLWQTLLVALPPSTAIDVGRLIERADDQLAVLSRLHRARIDVAFPHSITAP